MEYILLKFAQKLVIGTDESKNQVNLPTLTDELLLKNGLNLFYFIVGAVAVIVIIVAGIMYATSGGDSGSVTKAKNMILYSVVGLIIVSAAFAITNFVAGNF